MRFVSTKLLIHMTGLLLVLLGSSAAAEEPPLVANNEEILYLLAAAREDRGVYVSGDWHPAGQERRSGHVMLIYRDENRDPLGKRFRIREYAVVVNCRSNEVVANRAIQGDFLERKDAMRLSSTGGINDLTDAVISKLACSARKEEGSRYLWLEWEWDKHLVAHPPLGVVKGFRPNKRLGDYEWLLETKCTSRPRGTRFAVGSGPYSMAFVSTAHYTSCEFRSPFTGRPELVTFAGVTAESYKAEFCDGELVELDIGVGNRMGGESRAVSRHGVVVDARFPHTFVLDSLVRATKYPTLVVASRHWWEERSKDSKYLGGYKRYRVAFADWMMDLTRSAEHYATVQLVPVGKQSCYRKLDGKEDFK